MTRANRAGAQPPEDDSKSRAKTTGTGSTPATRGDTMQKPTVQSTTPSGAATAKPTGKGKQSGKSTRPVIGGTAVAGAKTTQPKAVSQSNNPQQQQAENYNRSMRRRMQKLGTGPYSESLAATAQERRQKRIERKKRKSAELRQQVTRGQRVNLSLGKRNTYFLIAMIALLVIIIVIAIIIRHPFF